MSERITKPQTSIGKTTSNGNSKVLKFEPFKTLKKIKGGGHVEIYEAFYDTQFFGYLYTTSDRYSLVWRNSKDFNFELPYLLMEFQFSDKTAWRIDNLRPIYLPFRKEKKDFFYRDATASVVLHEEESAREFDMLDTTATTKYLSEFINEQPSSISRIAFARYDSEIMFQGALYKVCFTAERLNQKANDDWEFVVNLPRQIVLRPHSLQWAVENHESRELMQGMNLPASLAELSDTLSQ